MANTVTPVYTDNIAVVAAQVLARGSVASGTINTGGGGASMKFGAWLMLAVGRGGTTALTNGVDVLIRRIINNNAATAGGVHPDSGQRRLSSTVAANSTTVSSDSNSGQAVLTVASGTGFAADDVICIQDSGAGVTRLEFHRISKISGGTITLDRNLQFSHTAAQADTVRNKADVFAPIWLPPGSLYEVIFDYGDDAAGESVTIVGLAQSYDSDSIV